MNTATASFKNNCETNNRNVSVTKMSHQKNDRNVSVKKNRLTD